MNDLFFSSKRILKPRVRNAVSCFEIIWSTPGQFDRVIRVYLQISVIINSFFFFPRSEKYLRKHPLG